MDAWPRGPAMGTRSATTLKSSSSSRTSGNRPHAGPSPKPVTRTGRHVGVACSCSRSPRWSSRLRACPSWCLATTAMRRVSASRPGARCGRRPGIAARRMHPAPRPMSCRAPPPFRPVSGCPDHGRGRVHDGSLAPRRRAEHPAHWRARRLRVAGSPPASLPAIYLYADGRLIRWSEAGVLRGRIRRAAAHARRRRTSAVRVPRLGAVRPNPAGSPLGLRGTVLCPRRRWSPALSAPVGGSAAEARLVSYLRTLDSSLPKTEWAAPRIRTYVASRFSVCLGTYANVPDRAIPVQIDLSTVLPAFPTGAAELFGGREAQAAAPTAPSASRRHSKKREHSPTSSSARLAAGRMNTRES